jgi:hypothetical protein
VNQYRDIEEGFAVFDEERERETYESDFLCKPHLFKGEVQGKPFTPIQVTRLHIQGSRANRPASAFDFEDGFTELLGFLDGQFGALELRWSEFGKQRDSKFVAATA